MRRVFIACVVALAAGCGKSPVEVSGVVTYNGTPLEKPEGRIVFVGPEGSQIVAEIAADGRYRAVGVPQGPNRVAVYYTNPNAKIRRTPSMKDKSKPTGTLPPSPPFITPYHYASPDTSLFAVEVGRRTTFDAAMTGPPIR